MTYLLRLREHVFKTKEENKLTFEETAKRFNIPVRTLFRWQQRVEPVTRRNKPATKIDMEALKEDVAEYPDAYQWERAQRLKVAERTVGYALKRLGVSYKKNVQASESRCRETSHVRREN